MCNFKCPDFIYLHKSVYENSCTNSREMIDSTYEILLCYKKWLCIFKYVLFQTENYLNFKCYLHMET